MVSYDWNTFLKHWNDRLFEIATNDPDYDEFFPAEIFARRWLGYAGATPMQIIEVEKAFGRELPPSYRQFLQYTNGWCASWYDQEGELSAYGLVELWSSAQVLARLKQYKEEGWGWWKLARAHHEGITPVMPADLEQDYLNYAEQDPHSVPASFMLACLEIGGSDGNEYFLLNPLVVNREGEWEAWMYNKEGGFWRFPSFYELLCYQKDSRSYMKQHYHWYVE